eukprot:CAMPEP_0180073534 /NCGR_PEP_ID=MMETSP0985-20121206/13331_1 /TAXON_ID=483367 /ORGANISM="non described non described, Strain CCMP 2436" /LENGTH=31 /DNA_ID= /DNA_START= /DNA_END= /DNA_ORIENTATION=
MCEAAAEGVCAGGTNAASVRVAAANSLPATL